jgi:hypothetical protein
MDKFQECAYSDKTAAVGVAGKTSHSVMRKG